MENKDRLDSLINAYEHTADTAFDRSTLNFLKELREYRKASEQGLLFKLPCKIGDEFFVIAYSSNVITHVKCTGYVIQEDTANKIKGCHIWLDSIENPRDYWKLSFDDFKIQCFATKEQAEQALKEMEGNR